MQDAEALAQTAVCASLSDVELATRASKGDELAFERIMRRHNQLLFRTARSILKSDAESEDAVQEAYLSAWRALGSFRDDARLSTWLVRIVINESLGRLRRRDAQMIPLDSAMELAEQQEQAWMVEEPNRQPEQMAFRAEMGRLIESRIHKLPDAYRTVFVLHALEELSAHEIAAALEISEATVRTRFFRARRLLRQALSREVDLAIGDAFTFAGQRCDRIVARVLARLADERERLSRLQR